MFDNVKTVPSSDQNVKKLVFEIGGTKPAVAEAVLYRYGEYNTRTVVSRLECSILLARMTSVVDVGSSGSSRIG